MLSSKYLFIIEQLQYKDTYQLPKIDVALLIGQIATVSYQKIILAYTKCRNMISLYHNCSKVFITLLRERLLIT